jgi:hypothetical protein
MNGAKSEVIPRLSYDRVSSNLRTLKALLDAVCTPTSCIYDNLLSMQSNFYTWCIGHQLWTPAGTCDEEVLVCQIFFREFLGH